MAFGQSSGPPANGKQLRELLELLEAAGHSDYRDARGPMGFSQRQAAGKFTSGEADEFIERLQTEIHGDGPPPGSRPPPAARAPKPAAPKPAPPKPLPRKTAAKRPSTPPAATTSLGNVPVEELAAELQRRGWVVLEP
jgi:hypothetical protein